MLPHEHVSIVEDSVLVTVLIKLLQIYIQVQY
jgi:hypothetical protein